ncbi:MAG TPA: Spy/CpxP family protein refolding chaperone [Burkholderiales bacterium]|jgi:Spy/CpxP family protein refolding chaperone|nr:Spy/CpxP family protein refolding chaperone [Burkholderiales bacterium]
MNTNRKVIASMIAAAALAASGSLVHAQPQKSATESGARADGPGERHGMRGGHQRHGQFSNPAARVEGYLAALKVELKITPAQEKAWQTFADKTRKQAEARSAQRAKFKGSKPADNVSAPERMAQRTAFMKQAVASMEARTAAVTELYAALTPEQKALADKQFARGHGGRFHRGGHGHGHGPQPKA